MDRRQLLKRGAAAGVVAWTAPVILAQQARADGVCTPRCLPAGTPEFGGSASGECLNREYRITVSLSVTGVTCECGGAPSLDPPALIGTVAAGFRGTVQLATPNGINVTCIDGTGDTCSVNCQVTAQVQVAGNPGNDCARNTVTLLGLTSACSIP